VLAQKMIDLKRDLMAYAGLVQDMIEKSVRGLLTKNRGLLLTVIETEEPRSNDWEITMDELCTHIIAQFEPKARDLRTALMVLGMNKDLERMADHAVNIAENALYLIERSPVKPFLDIPRMADEARGMVRDCLLAFLNEDAALARNVCERDSIVDGLEKQILRELITYMTSDATTIERALRLLDVAKNLERIADLSTNIGEDVIFMVEGLVIKHHRDETPPGDGEIVK
jgi:phosphate transport system protein